MTPSVSKKTEKGKDKFNTRYNSLRNSKVLIFNVHLQIGFYEISFSHVVLCFTIVFYLKLLKVWKYFQNFE